MMMPKPMRRPQAPTRAEWEAHIIAHVPYREWCPHCVAGRGISNQHRRNKEQDNSGVAISVDYLKTWERRCDDGDV